MYVSRFFSLYSRFLLLTFISLLSLSLLPPPSLFFVITSLLPNFSLTFTYPRTHFASFPLDRLEGMKALLAMISKGKDVSDFFPPVVKLVVVKNVEIKKMVITCQPPVSL